MTTPHATWGPRLVANPTGALRAALAVTPPPAIERAKPLPGEPNAVHSRASGQHAILVKTLEYFGCEVTLLESKSNDPYASSIADAAVVFENGAVILRPSSMTRRPVTAWLEERLHELDGPIAGHVSAPGLLDGAEILMAGKTAFIGASRRSNELARSGFAQIAKAHGFETVEVKLADAVPSLRSIAGVLSADSLAIGPPDLIDHGAFKGFKTFVTQRGQELGAGVLNIGEHHVIADVRFRGVNEMLRRGGITVEALDLYDFDRVGVSASMLILDLKRI
jgi:dimethylargininase